MIRNIRKDWRRGFVPSPVAKVEPKEEPKTEPITKNKKEKKEKNMTNEQIERAEDILQNMELPNQGVKVLKKDRGLIERVESSKIILTEDNRQVLND